MILSFLGKYREAGLLILRCGVGAMFVLHGAPKLLDGPEKWAALGGAMSHLGVTAVPALWGFLAALSECGGGICLVLGIATRPAAIMMAGTMTVATVSHMMGDGSFLERLAEASHAIEALAVFLGLSLLGAGKYSLDGK